MKQLSVNLGDQTYPVIEFRRRAIYLNGERTSLEQSSYTVFYKYEKIPIAVKDDGTAVTQEQVKEAADNGTPVQMLFKDLVLTVRGTENPWQIQVNGTASHATLVKEK